jgi:predicted hydrocarbon binding protein
MGRIVLSGMEEVLGRSELNALLGSVSLGHSIDLLARQDFAIPFDHLAALLAALERSYGTLAGQGLALRAGRACFKYGLAEYGEQLGLTTLEFRLLPLPAKLETGGQALATLLNEGLDLGITMNEDRQGLYWNMGQCPLCWGRRVQGHCCHLAVGVLQEACFWVSGGKIFQIEETRCIAQGDSACTILIDRQPIG